ncbi:MAG: LysM peptidoglycan-binding domain-containing protein [Planctomycetota bacterium]
MNSDRKIGFAMGILLIGVVAALFFRQEPVTVTEQLSPQRRQQLNQRIRDRDIAVYIPDEESSAALDADAVAEPHWTLRTVLEDLDQKNRTAPAPVQTARSLEEHTSNRDSLDGYRTWKPGRGAIASPATDLAGASRPLPPLHAPNETLFFSAQPSEKLVTATKPDSDSPSGASARPVTSPAPAGEFDEHTVQFGETLSSIAAHYLGSQSRYGLIFEANRDRLTSADRLQVGMKLRIPRRTASTD